MKNLKSGKSGEAQPAPIATTIPIPRRYCNHCHLSTPKANPRCIHCRCLLAPHVQGKARVLRESGKLPAIYGEERAARIRWKIERRQIVDASNRAR